MFEGWSEEMLGLCGAVMIETWKRIQTSFIFFLFAVCCLREDIEFVLGRLTSAGGSHRCHDLSFILS